MRKAKVDGVLGRLGLRVRPAKNCRRFTDAANYPELDQVERPVIFDVGAHFGETSVAYRRSFPKAEIHAFEPMDAAHDRLALNAERSRITAHKLAMGDCPTTTEVVVNRDDPTSSMHSLLHTPSSATDVSQSVDVETVASFCERMQIDRIDILKIDAEGFDLRVVEGAAPLLRSGAVGAVITEASRPGHPPHVSIFEMNEALEQHGFSLYSVYDATHDPSGRLTFVNLMHKPAVRR